MLDFETIVDIISVAPTDPKVRATFADPEMDNAAIARVIAHLSDDNLPLILGILPAERLTEVLSLIDHPDAARILLDADHEIQVAVIDAMQPDDAADVIASMPESDRSRIIAAMPADEAQELTGLLAWQPNTAAALMTPAFVAVSPKLTADEAIAGIRQVSEEYESVHDVFVVDKEARLIGVLPLDALVRAPGTEFVSHLMDASPVSVLVDTDQESAAKRMQDHDVVTMPVVDVHGVLVGVISHDDILDVLEQEATRDIEQLGGSQPLELPYRRAGVAVLYSRRVWWLLALFLAEAYTGTVLRHYEDEIQQVVALSFFIPLLIGTGGNVGTQVTTTLVRAVGLHEISLRDMRWVFLKEVQVGLLLGATMGLVAFARAQLLHVGVDIGVVIAVTVLSISIWSAAVASLLPLALGKLRVDPAVVSAPLISTLVDGTGLIIYFTIAKLLLHL